MIATLERKPLGQLLIDKGLIKPDQLERAVELLGLDEAFIEEQLA